MQDIRKQFSLDWLSDSENARSGSAADLGQTGLDEAVLFYAAPILKQLERAPSGQIGLHDLARALKDEVSGFQFAAMWEVVMNLSSRSMIELADTSDPTGNYIIRLAARTSAK